MAQVAQAYFHFETRLTETELKKFGGQVKRASRSAAQYYFDHDVLIHVDIEEGSLIGRVTASMLVLSGLTGLVANYKGVKDSVKEMCEDARSFGTDVCAKAIKFAGVNEKQVYRVERRTKTVGKLGRLLGDIERVENSRKELSDAQMDRELARFNRELRLIAKDLEPEEQQALEGVLKDTKLPPPSKWPNGQVEEPRSAVKREQLLLSYDEPLAIEDPNKRVKKPLHYQNTFKVRIRKRAGSRPSLLTASKQPKEPIGEAP